MFCELIHTYFAIFFKRHGDQSSKTQSHLFSYLLYGGLNKLYKIQIIRKYALRTGL